MSVFLTRCAHPFCSVVVTDWNAVTCRHGVTVCEGCIAEEACESCGGEVA